MRTRREFIQKLGLITGATAAGTLNLGCTKQKATSEEVNKTDLHKAPKIQNDKLVIDNSSPAEIYIPAQELKARIGKIQIPDDASFVFYAALDKSTGKLDADGQGKNLNLYSFKTADGKKILIGSDKKFTVEKSSGQKLLLPAFLSNTVQARTSLDKDQIMIFAPFNSNGQAKQLSAVPFKWLKEK